MKLRLVTKLDKGNTKTYKKFDDEVMYEYCDVIILFPIYGQSGTMENPNSGGIIC